MTDERYKKIMADLGMPNSRSLLVALQQVANEAGQVPAQAAPAAVVGSDEIDRLRAALVYVAFALHDTRQYMLAEGVTLIDGDTVRVSRDGWTVEASSNPLRQPEPAPQQAGTAEVVECGNLYAKVKLRGDAFGSTNVGDVFYSAPQPATQVCLCN